MSSGDAYGAQAASSFPLIAVDVQPAKLALARELGATHCIDARVADPVEAIREITRGGATNVFESVGSEQVLARPTPPPGAVAPRSPWACLHRIASSASRR